jgi:hypothetical protein
MRQRSIWSFLVVLTALAAIGISAAERTPDKAVGSTSLKPSPAIDTHAMNAMLRADSDKDGTLSQQELEQYDLTLARRFGEADSDHDGKLTFYEFEKLLPGATSDRATAALRP